MVLHSVVDERMAVEPHHQNPLEGTDAVYDLFDKCYAQAGPFERVFARQNDNVNAIRERAERVMSYWLQNWLVSVHSHNRTLSAVT